jgi:hypothetical protein
MAFTSAILHQGIAGDMRMNIGSYTNDSGSTGGDITTGLQQVHAFFLQPKGTAVATNASVVNEALQAGALSDPITIVTDANQVGQFIAFGY